MRLDSPQDMDKSALQSKIRSRRTHNKSRLGCKNCKRRRVKCDEKRPSCTNCLQHSIDCDFGNVAVSNSATPSPPAGGGVSNPPFRFRQSKYQTLSCPSPTSEPTPTPTSTATTATHSTGVQCDLSISYNSDSGGISLADLQLYHNYITSTYKTLAHEPDDIHKVYQVHLPQWGFTFPSILHLTLAISALHLASQHPDQREKYIRQADDHFTFGVRSVTSILAHLDSQNCQRIYISAVLICLIYFGHGPPAGEYIVFSETGQAEWLVLMRGVRSILYSKHSEIFSGILEPVPGPVVEEISPLLADELRQHIQHIEEVKEFLETQVTHPDAREMYVSVCTKLAETFNETYKMRSQGRDGVCLMPAVIGWIYRLPEEFVQLLQEKDCFALVILAQWSILLKYMGTSWLMTGWDRHVIGGIRMSLGPEFHRWIEWPWEVIYGHSTGA